MPDASIRLLTATTPGWCWREPGGLHFGAYLESLATVPGGVARLDQGVVRDDVRRDPGGLHLVKDRDRLAEVRIPGEVARLDQGVVRDDVWVGQPVD